MHGEACVAELTATQYASLYNFGFTFRDMPGSVRHLRWFHPGRAPAMVHLLPTWNSYAYERGDVSFTSGMDRLRSSFHGRYQLNRTGPLGHDMLFIKFKWHGEVVDEECLPHTLVACDNGPGLVYRDEGRQVVAEIISYEIALPTLLESDRVYLRLQEEWHSGLQQHMEDTLWDVSESPSDCD